MLLIEKQFREKFLKCMKCKYNKALFCTYYKEYINRKYIKTCKWIDNEKNIV